MLELYLIQYYNRGLNCKVIYGAGLCLFIIFKNINNLVLTLSIILVY